MSHMPVYAGQPDTNKGPSPAIWGNCPWDHMLQDPRVGYCYFDDFLGPLDPTTACGWTITQVTSGTIHLADMAGGGMVFDSAGNATADDGINAQMLDATGGENWKPAVGKTLWFEARVKLSDCATTPDQFFLGLCDRETAIFASGVIDTTARNLIGFYTDGGSTTGRLSFASAKAGTAEKTVLATIADSVADATFFKIGFMVKTVDGDLVIVPYFNGEALTKVTDTDDIPILEMALSAVAQVEQTSADAEMTVDWVRIAQLR